MNRQGFAAVRVHAVAVELFVQQPVFGDVRAVASSVVVRV